MRGVLPGLYLHMQSGCTEAVAACVRGDLCARGRVWRYRAFMCAVMRARRGRLRGRLTHPQVLSLYRECLRVARTKAPDMQADILRIASQEFREHKTLAKSDIECAPRRPEPRPLRSAAARCATFACVSERNAQSSAPLPLFAAPMRCARPCFLLAV